jgi:hypothetical protein
MAPLEERDRDATHDLRWALSRAGAWLFAVGLLLGAHLTGCSAARGSSRWHGRSICCATARAAGSG